jgi:hypothetical protein
MLEATATNSPTNTNSSPISINYTKSSLYPPHYPSRPTPTLTLHLSPTAAHVPAQLRYFYTYPKSYSSTPAPTQLPTPTSAHTSSPTPNQVLPSLQRQQHHQLHPLHQHQLMRQLQRQLHSLHTHHHQLLPSGAPHQREHQLQPSLKHRPSSPTLAPTPSPTAAPTPYLHTTLFSSVHLCAISVPLGIFVCFLLSCLLLTRHLTPASPPPPLKKLCHIIPLSTLRPSLEFSMSTQEMSPLNTTVFHHDAVTNRHLIHRRWKIYWLLAMNGIGSPSRMKHTSQVPSTFSRMY